MIIVERKKEWPDSFRYEVVERKGLGHPDTIMDSIVEECSREISRYYIEKFGYILHHNIDKGVLVAGKANPKFGGGEVLQKIRVLVVGRLTTKVGNEEIPYEELMKNAFKRYLERNFRFLKEDHINFEIDVKPGSVDLTSMYEQGKEVPLANDTSIGASFYPLTVLEEIVYKTEKVLNSKEIKRRYPYIGEDIKVLGTRNEDKIILTIAAAFVDKFVENEQDYLEKKEEISEIVERKVLSDYYYDFEINVNTADIPEKGIFYLTVTGSSAESGDDGQVGRGNRVNGLITPLRRMSLEATAGKNARSHVGKIYNVWAKWTAKRIFEDLGYRNSIIIVSKIGHPITEPQSVFVEIYESEFSRNDVERIIKENLDMDIFEEIQKKIIREEEELF